MSFSAYHLSRIFLVLSSGRCAVVTGHILRAGEKSTEVPGEMLVREQLPGGRQASMCISFPQKA